MAGDPALETTEGAVLLLERGWLSRQPEDFRRAMLAILVWKQVAAGDTIIIGGDADGGLWGVAEGYLDITSAISTADSPPAHIGQPGSWWGPMPVFGGRRNSNVTARTDALLALVPLGALQALLAANPGWWRAVGALAVELMEVAAVGLADLLIRDPRLRCVAVLLRVAGCRLGLAPTEAVTVPVSQDDFAAMTNLSRGSAGAVLRGLAAEGQIRLGYRSITLIAPERLRRLLDS